jgi:hypothetical protein
MNLSLIVAVLESHEVVRRQLLHLGRILTPDCELILVDDGSVPSLEAICAAVEKPFPFTLHCTHDRRPWTQPHARYDELCAAGGARPPEVRGVGYYYPDPAFTRELFHSLQRNPREAR